MKKIKKSLALIMALSLSLSTLAACGGNTDDSTKPLDEGKTQLYVYSYPGGYGNDWLTKVSERFEKAYEDYEGVNGKVGVQIMPDTENKTIGTSFLDTVLTEKNEVFFTESVFYYDWVKGDGTSDKLLDLTTAVTTPLTDLNESKSVYDKMTPEQQSFLNAGTEADKKIYAVPYRTDVEGIIYDVDLFDSEFLYYEKGGCPSEYCDFTQANNEDVASGSFTSYSYTNLEGERSAGPDGKYGTDDDGLPATYEEFFNLCHYMVYGVGGITPFTWVGETKSRSNYLGWLYQQMLADYEGLDGYTSYFTYEGTSDRLVESIDNNGNITYKPETNIADDGSLIARSDARYYVSKFFEELIKNNSAYYTGSSFNGTQTHMLAQMDYLESKYSNERIAFLVDGIWWENEANDTFEDMEDIESEDGRLSRRFALMQLPKAKTSQIGEPATYVDTHASLAFVRKNIDASKVDIAEKFIRFCFTEMSNKEFTLETGCARKMGDYTLNDNELKNLSYFGQSVYKVVTSAPVVAPYGKNDVYKANVSNYDIKWGGKFNVTEASIFDEFKYGDMTAAQIFKNSMNALDNYFNK